MWLQDLIRLEEVSEDFRMMGFAYRPVNRGTTTIYATSLELAVSWPPLLGAWWYKAVHFANKVRCECMFVSLRSVEHVCGSCWTACEPAVTCSGQLIDAARQIKSNTAAVCVCERAVCVRVR